MKIKTLMLSVLVAGFTVSANAQKSEKGDKELSAKCKDNFFISVGVGAQGYINIDNMDYGFGKCITPLFNLSLGKMMSPYWGLRGQVSGVKTKLYTDINRLNNGNVFEKYSESYVGVYGDFLLNVSNLWRAYSPDNKFDLMLFAGPGLNFGKFQDTQVDVLINGSVGVGGKYNINQFWAIDLEARASMMPSFYEGKGRTNQDGILGVSAGVTYTIGGRKFKKYTDAAVATERQIALQNEVNRLKKEKTVQQSEIKVLKAQKSEGAVKTVVKEVYTNLPPTTITFAFNSSVVTKVQEVGVCNWVRFLKANPDVKINLTGYADKRGSAAANKKISERRAEAILKLFVKYGIAKDRISLNGKGDFPYYDESLWNRCVLIEIVK